MRQVLAGRGVAGGTKSENSRYMFCIPLLHMTDMIRNTKIPAMQLKGLLQRRYFL
jgi:hypothetical protein